MAINFFFRDVPWKAHPIDSGNNCARSIGRFALGPSPKNGGTTRATESVREWARLHLSTSIRKLEGAGSLTGGTLMSSNLRL